MNDDTGCSLLRAVLPVDCLGLIGVLGGIEGFSQMVTTTSIVRDSSLEAARDALAESAFCRRCRAEYEIYVGSHCEICGVRLRSVLEWELWRTRFRQRFVLEALDMLQQRSA